MKFNIFKENKNEYRSMTINDYRIDLEITEDMYNFYITKNGYGYTMFIVGLFKHNFENEMELFGAIYSQLDTTIAIYEEDIEKLESGFDCD